MAKIAEVQEVSLSSLVPYERNAKIHGQEQIEKLKASIQEFGFLTPCLIDRDNNIIAGHGRVMAAKELGMKTVPCVYIEGLTEEQRRAYILADNRLGDLGSWNMEVVNDELFDLSESFSFDVSLTGFDIPDSSSNWFSERERFDNSREEGNTEYNEFLEKFEEKKTTDDCYTPDNIYEVIAKYVEDRYKTNRKDFVRPFYPGGDYQAEKYKKNDIVVDNPPFSILAEIVDFYVETGRRFFLFAPGLSTICYTTRNGVATVCVYASITYENGASVATSFLTNMEDDDIVAITDPDLFKAIDAANQETLSKIHKSLPKYEYPVHVATAAKLGYLAKYGQALTIKRSDCVFIRKLDAQDEQDKAIFGGGLLLSEKAAAEKAAAEKWSLSARELNIISKLGGE